MIGIAIPFICGIAFSWLCGIHVLCSALLFAVGVVGMICGLHNAGFRTLFTVSMLAAVFALGMLAERLDSRRLEQRWSGSKGRFEAVLQEFPHVGGRSTRVLAHVTRIGRDSVPGARRQGAVDLYFANSVDVERLRAGERIFFEGRVKPPRNAGNPAEFDLEHYCYVKGVTGTVFLPVSGWSSRGVTEPTLQMRALQIRERIVDMYASLGIDGDVHAVLSALTVGEKRDLSHGIREIYSDVGASHILALSGLHLGILYMILTFLFPVRGGRMWVMLVRELAVVAALWAFAFVAGLVPSVVRSALLFTLFSLARCMRRDNSSMNALAFAAVAMLIYSPRYLFDIGFQLSFMAVASILLLNAPLRRLLHADSFGRVYGYFAGLLAVSIASQIGTLPVVWHCFGSFPLCFLFTNIVIVPMAFLVMLMALLLIALVPLPMLQQIVAVVLVAVVSGMNGFLRWLSSLPFASTELPHVAAVEALAFGLFLLCMLYGIVCRKRIAVCMSLLLLLVPVVGIVAGMRHSEPPHVVFYNNNRFPSAHFVYNRSRSYLATSYPEWEVDMEYVIRPYLRRERMDEPHLLSDGFSDSKVSFADGVVCFAGRRIKMLADDCWLDDMAIIPVDCLFLCRGFLGKMEELLLRYPTRYVILDATMYRNSCTRIKRECSALGVRCIDLKETGAIKMFCDNTGLRFAFMRGK